LSLYVGLSHFILLFVNVVEIANTSRFAAFALLLTLFVLILDQFLLLTENLQTLLVGCSALCGVHLQLNLVEELFRDTGQDSLQSIDLRVELYILALGVHESVGEDKESAGNSVLETQLEPKAQVIAESGGRDTMSTQTARSTCSLELGYRQSLNTFERDGSVITLDLAHTMSDLVTKHGIGAESGQGHVTADTNELRAREIVKSQIILEDLTNTNDIGLCGSLASGANLD
jgi:hypothetical protein